MSDINSFVGKVLSKLKTTLGFYISINGYSSSELDTKDSNEIILCDSIDLMMVLENRVSLVDLINRKKQEASRTGKILFRVL